MAKKKSTRAPKSAKSPAQPTAQNRSWLRGFDPSQWVLWILLFSVPLIFIPGLTENFRTPKLFATELLALASLALLCLRSRSAALPNLSHLIRLPMVQALAPLTLVVLISAALSPHKEVVARGLPSFLIGIVVLLGWNLGLTPAERQKFLRGLLWPAALLSILGILQFHGLFEPFSFTDRISERIGLTSLAGGVFDLGGYLFLPIWVAVIWWPKTRGSERVAVSVGLALCCYTLLISRSLTVVAATGVSVAAFFVLRGMGQAMGRRLAAMAVVSVMVFGLLSTVGPLAPRLSGKIDNLRQGELNRLLSGRLDGWYSAVRMFEDHPVTGVGPGAFRSGFGPAKLSLAAEGVEFYRGQHRVFFVNAHNDYLEAIAEWGLLGGAALAWALWMLVSARSRRRQDGGHTLAIRPVEVPVMTGMAVIAAGNFPFHIGLIAYPWLLFISGLVDSQPAEAEAEEPRRKAKALLVLLSLALLAYLPVRFHQIKDRLGADRLVAIVEAQTRQVLAQGGRAPGQLMQLNIGMLKKAQEMDPASISAKIGLAGQYMFLKRYPAAIRELKEAAELEQRAEVYANLARCYLATNQREEAFEAIQMAIQLDHTQRKQFREQIQKENRLKKWREKQKGSSE